MRAPFISAIVAGSLLVSATAAGARQPDAPAARSGADVGQSDELFDNVFVIIGIVAVLLVIGIFVIFDDDDDELPSSP